jgi:tRNA pseudouridine38-40 synthase
MVFALNADSKIQASRINAALPADVRVLAVREVQDGFDPRRDAKERVYRYYLYDDGYDVPAIREAARAFVGARDFHNFTKDKGDTVRRVTGVGVQKRYGFIVITIRGHAFLWQQVRRMVSALRMVGSGELTQEDITVALKPEENKVFRPAPAEPLVLWEVKYDFDFKTEGYTARRFGKALTDQWKEVNLKVAQIKDIRRMI